MTSLLKHQSKRAAGGFLTAVLLASVLSVAAVSAQTSSGSSCSGDFVRDIEGIQFIVGGVTTADLALAAPIPAGTYDLNAASRDEHDGRESLSPQPQEQWVVEFLDSNNNVLATSQPTADLADNTAAATWDGSIGSVTLAADAVSARAVHAAPTSSSANSVFPVCFGATLNAPVAVAEDPADDEVARSVGGDEDPVTSSITLDYDSDAEATSSAAVICDNSANVEAGDQIDIVVDDIELGSQCVVGYPENLSCTVVVDPAPSNVGERAGEVIIGFPADAPLSVFVDIDCTDPELAAAPVVTTVAPEPAAPAVTTTTAAPAPVTTTTVASGTAAATATPTTVVSSTQNAPAAPAAQPRVGTPAFTG